MRSASLTLLLLGATLGVSSGCDVYNQDIFEGMGTTGGLAPTGGVSGSGGVPIGGATGGFTPTGGVSTGGASPTGGVGPTGGDGTGGGGAPTGGVPPTGGVAPTGGAGTGGGPATGGAGPGTFVTIDALEELNDTIELSDGQGYWYTYHDDSASGTIAPDTQRNAAHQVAPTALATARADSTLAVHVTANNLFTVWGSGVGFDLNNKNVYDLSGYTGIVFWARAEAAVTMRLKVLTAEIVLNTEPGGECVQPASPTPAQQCGNAYGYRVNLTTAWQEFRIPFASLTQESGWGQVPPAGFNPESALSVQLQAAKNVAWDVWLDDIRFYVE